MSPPRPVWPYGLDKPAGAEDHWSLILAAGTLMCSHVWKWAGIAFQGRDLNLSTSVEISWAATDMDMRASITLITIQEESAFDAAHMRRVSPHNHV